jgi:hypothetical protein
MVRRGWSYFAAFLLATSSCGGNSSREENDGAPGNSGSGAGGVSGNGGADGGVMCVVNGSGAACPAPEAMFYCPKSTTPPPQCSSCDWTPGAMHYTCIPPPEIASAPLGCMRCCCPQ